MNTRGAAAEARALAWLTAQGLHCLAQNYACRFGEIDLIMQHGETLVFVEVRHRRHSRFGTAAESITPRKCQKLLLTAEHYLQSLTALPVCRFDAVLLDGNRDPEWVQRIID